MSVQMIPKYEDSLQSELWELLDQLSSLQLKDEQEKHNYIEKFCQLYYIDKEHYFRHSYGTLSGNLISKSKGETDDGWTEVLIENLKRLDSTLFQKIAEQDEDSEDFVKDFQTYKSLLKLQDHVASESIRLQQVYRQYHDEAEAAKRSYIEAKLKSDEAKTLSDEATAKSDEAKALSNEAQRESKKAKKLSRDAANVKTEVVTILSIFAAIILMFSGGLTILGSAISSMHDVIIYKVLVVTLLCIIGIFDAIFLLLYVAAKISDKSLLVACASGECIKDKCKKCIEKNKNICNPIMRFQKRLPYVFWFNFLIFTIIALTILAWALDVGGLARWIQENLPW